MRRFIIFIIGIGVGSVLINLLLPISAKEIRRKITLKKPGVRDKITRIKEIYSKFKVE